MTDWTLAVQDEETGIGGPPQDDRDVLVFLNGHVEIGDTDGRQGGGWGIRLGWFDHDKRCWRAHGLRESFVTHWMDLPEPPKR